MAEIRSNTIAAARGKGRAAAHAIFLDGISYRNPIAANNIAGGTESHICLGPQATLNVLEPTNSYDGQARIANVGVDNVGPEVALTAGEGWEAEDPAHPPSVRKPAAGSISLSGSFRNWGSATLLVTTLPKGFRPGTQRLVQGLAHDGDRYLTCPIALEPNGSVTLQMAAAAQRVVLDGVQALLG
jgi:hypothetical protein